jgi:hypothetical protein
MTGSSPHRPRDSRPTETTPGSGADTPATETEVTPGEVHPGPSGTGQAARSTERPGLAPPPPSNLIGSMRRRWRSRGRHRPLRYWILFRGLPLFGFYAVIFALNGFLIGWRDAYDLSVHITSPRGVPLAVLPWILSIASWLLVPAIAGAVAGYVVGAQIGERRGLPLSEAFED